MSKRVAIILPAFNEAKVLEKVVKDITKALSGAGSGRAFQFEVVVVDDGSVDETSQVAKRSGATLIRHLLNTGSGGATATGLSYAERQGFDLAATIDADGQHNPADLLRGIEIMLAKDAPGLLIGSRLINSNGMSKVKILGNRGISLITGIIFGVTVTDSQSGLRIFSKKALGALKWRTNGYEFCSEMLWRAKQQHLQIKEYPIQAIYTEYSTSKGQNSWNGVNIVFSLLRQRIVELFSE